MKRPWLILVPLLVPLPVLAAWFGCRQEAPSASGPPTAGPPSIQPATSQPSSGGRADDAQTLVFYNGAGKVVATGKLRIPDRLPGRGQSFEGTWQLTSADASFPSHGAKSGRYSGYVHDTGVSLDLHPNMADSNVVLSGPMAAGAFAGKWYYATDAGDEEMGRFAHGRTAMPPEKPDAAE